MSFDKKTVPEIITEQIVENMKNNNSLVWNRPWQVLGFPKNLISDKEYQGINTFILGLCNNFDSTYWVTAKQAKNLGGFIDFKKQKGSCVVFYKPVENKKTIEMDNVKTGKKENVELNESYSMLRYYRVWNVCQVEGLKHNRIEEEKETLKSLKDKVIKDSINQEGLDKANNIIENYKKNNPSLTFTNGGDSCFYKPSIDSINMVDQNRFNSLESEKRTLFHELGHSTGHISRFDRFSKEGSYSFQSHNYSFEELIAEFTSAYLMGESNIFEPNGIESSSAYIKGWLSKLTDNPKWIIQSASKANKAYQYILNNTK